jgi:hypothetical protein
VNRPASVNIPNAVIDGFLKPAHIAKANAEALFTQADAIDTLDSPNALDASGNQVLIVERHVKAKHVVVHLLGIGMIDTDGTATAHIVLRIPPRLRSDEIAPLATLKRLLEGGFGLPITVGSKTGKFIVQESVTLGSGRVDRTNLMKVDPSSNHDFRAGTYLMMRALDGVNYADCALCFALDMTLYRQSISN